MHQLKTSTKLIERIKLQHIAIAKFNTIFTISPTISSFQHKRSSSTHLLSLADKMEKTRSLTATDNIYTETKPKAEVERRRKLRKFLMRKGFSSKLSENVNIGLFM